MVAGGQREWWTTLATVEVMDTDTLTWSTASTLPHPLSDATAAVCEERVYLVGGNLKCETAMFSCTLSALLQAQTSETVWHLVIDVPVEYSTIVTLNKQLLAIGGSNCQALIRHHVTTFTNATIQ